MHRQRPTVPLIDIADSAATADADFAYTGDDTIRSLLDFDTLLGRYAFAYYFTLISLTAFGRHFDFID
jgi:hypothetical protein